MSSLVKHSGGGVMTWACMAVPGTSSIILIDDVTHDSSRMNSFYRNMLSASLERNSCSLIWRNVIMQQDNDSKHNYSKTKVFIRRKKCKVLNWPMSISYFH